MDLLNRLVQEVPNKSRNDGLFQLVREHFDEITQAKEKGYSWRQITRIAQEAWGDKLPVRQSFPLESYYRKIRKEKHNGQ